MDSGTESSGSDYEVEHFITPDKIRKSKNDDSADLLGNFDDEKRKEIFEGNYCEKETNNPSDAEDGEEVRDFSGASDCENHENGVSSEEDIEDVKEINEDQSKLPTTHLTSEQLSVLMRGASKAHRFVLYVTNLNFETVKEDLENYFSQAGEVKNIRIPRKRRGGFAFVEMATIDGFRNGFQLHNSELQGRKIKVQISEGGKKKSANKKNILKQKNRKLAEMRNEQKFFTKSGKYYDKNLKKEKAKELLTKNRWRKNPRPRPA